MGGVDKRQSFRLRESALHKQLPAAGCVRESRGVCVGGGFARFICMQAILVGGERRSVVSIFQ